jgi:hypothetical protein
LIEHLSITTREKVYALYAGGGWGKSNNYIIDPFVYVLATQFETDKIKMRESSG